MPRKIGPAESFCQKCGSSLIGKEHQYRYRYCSRDCHYASARIPRTPERIEVEKEQHRQASVRSRANRTPEEKLAYRVSQTLRYRRTKQRAVDYLGGECLRCGYRQCIAALDFHHRNPDTKDPSAVGANGNSLMTRRWDRIMPELDKCDLLCRNCHAEQHFAQEVK